MSVSLISVSVDLSFNHWNTHFRLQISGDNGQAVTMRSVRYLIVVRTFASECLPITKEPHGLTRSDNKFLMASSWKKRQVATVVLSLLDSCVDVSAREGLRFRFGGGISDSSRRLKVQHNKLIMSIVCIMEAFILTTPNI